MRALVVSRVLIVLTSAVLSGASAMAQQPMCGSGAEHDRYLEALHARSRALPRTAAAAEKTATLRDGAFSLPADETIAPGYRPFDLVARSLVFEPRGASRFAMQRTALQYVAPLSAPVRDFESDRSGEPWFAVARDLDFTLPIFGRAVTRIYVTAFNEIRFDPPSFEQTATQFGAAEAVAQPRAVVSPLIITSSKPRALAYPKVFIEESAGSVRVTWSSTAGATFGYDVQAELRGDGTVVFSYPSFRNLRWGAPLISSGFDASVPRTTLASGSDAENDVTTTVAPELRTMLDIRGLEAFRINDADVFSLRVKLGAAPDPAKLGEGESFRYLFVAEDDVGTVDIDGNGVVVTAFGAPRGVRNGVTARLSGDTIEMFGLQRSPSSPTIVSIRVLSYLRPQSRVMDATSTLHARFDPAPKTTSVDLTSLANGTELSLPITESFVLAPLDVYAVWDRLQAEYSLSDEEVDGLAIYQSFFTDIIFYAGAYSTRGNPGVDGISPGMPPYRQMDPRTPALLHMNQLTYNYSAAPATASKVLLHEFGHRWLFHISIAEEGTATRSLNPTSAHPAAYVHTPSAFPVYGENESSVMGGAYFALQGDGSYRARVANMGYSWTDLYLMGLATPSEVPPWFYLAGTSLPTEYWPEEGTVVNNPTRKDVSIDQILAVHGPRSPSTALSQRKFRLLFVLITEPGTQPTDAEIAKLTEWRALAERNFSIATGGRARLVTHYARPTKTRAVR